MWGIITGIARIEIIARVMTASNFGLVIVEPRRGILPVCIYNLKRAYRVFMPIGALIKHVTYKNGN
jgi:hypothetical protein